MNKRDDRRIHDIAVILARIILLQTNGDPASCLAVLCELSAEFMKFGGPKAKPLLRDKFIESLDRFLKVPNSIIAVPMQEERSEIIIPNGT